MITFEAMGHTLSFERLTTYFHAGRLHIAGSEDEITEVFHIMSNKGEGIVRLSPRWIWVVNTNDVKVDTYKNNYIVSWPKVRLVE